MFEVQGTTKYGIRKEGTFALLAKVITFITNGDETSIVTTVPKITKHKASTNSNNELCSVGLSFGIKAVCCSASASYIQIHKNVTLFNYGVLCIIIIKKYVRISK